MIELCRELDLIGRMWECHELLFPNPTPISSSREKNQVRIKVFSFLSRVNASFERSAGNSN